MRVGIGVMRNSSEVGVSGPSESYVLEGERPFVGIVATSGTENAGMTPVDVAGLRLILGSSVLARVRAGCPSESDCSDLRRPVEGLSGRSSRVNGDGSVEASGRSAGRGGERLRRRLKSECRRSPIERLEVVRVGCGGRSVALRRSGTLTAASSIGNRSRSR